MKKIEVRSLGVKSLFKTTIYIMIIPAIIMLFFGIIMLVMSLFIDDFEIKFLAYTYLLLPIVVTVIYGLISMLIAVVYNGLSKNFGGLVISINDKNEKNTIKEMKDIEEFEEKIEEDNME